MKVCYVLSLESPLQGDSNEHTQHTIINIKKHTTYHYQNKEAHEIDPHTIISATIIFFS